MRTYEKVKTTEGFYSSIKFDLSAVPPDVLGQAIEFDRACIAEPYRKTQALLLLWKGVALYSLHHQKNYFFSFCSLSSQNPTEAGRVFDLIKASRQQHRDFQVNGRPGFKCLWYQTPDCQRPPVIVPQPLRAYLRLGANVYGPPAMDRRLRTIDFFVVLDVNKIKRRVHRLLFPSSEESHEFARSA
jgi:putative hemolysin